MDNLFLEMDNDFDNFIVCLTKRCRDRKEKERIEKLEAEKQKQYAKEDAIRQARKNSITKLTKQINSYFPKFFDNVTNLATTVNSDLNDKTFLGNLNFRVGALYKFATEKDRFPNTSEIPSIARLKLVRAFINDRKGILNNRIAELDAEKKLADEKEANRIRTFNDLNSNHSWITSNLTPSYLDKITDFQIEDALQKVEEYLFFESNKNTIATYEGKIRSLKDEQKRRLEVDETPSYSQGSTSTNTSSTPSKGSLTQGLSDNASKSVLTGSNQGSSTTVDTGSLKEQLMKYKYYIGGALVLGVVGIIVIRKI